MTSVPVTDSSAPAPAGPVSARDGRDARVVLPTRHPARWAMAAVVLLIVAGGITQVVGNERFQWDVVGEYLFSQPILQGVAKTLMLTAAAMAIGVGLGVVIAVLRLSPNPIAVGVPTADPDSPFLLDMTTSVVAEGKIRVARNKKQPLGEGWAIDAEGRPTTDAEVYYGASPGSILPMGGASAYKGFALALMVEALAGALSPAGTSRPGGPRGGNGLFTMAIDIAHFRDPEDFRASFGGLIDYVQSPPFAPGVDHITVPGEPERDARHARAEAIPVDDETWRQLNAAAQSVGVAPLQA